MLQPDKNFCSIFVAIKAEETKDEASHRIVHASSAAEGSPLNSTAATRYEIEQEYDHCYHQQNVDECATDVCDQTQQPQNQKYTNDCP